MIGKRTYSDNVMALWSAVQPLVHEDQLTSVLVQSGGHMKGDNEIELKWGRCSLQLHVPIHGSIKLQ